MNSRNQVSLLCSPADNSPSAGQLNDAQAAQWRRAKQPTEGLVGESKDHDLGFFPHWLQVMWHRHRDWTIVFGEDVLLVLYFLHG